MSDRKELLKRISIDPRVCFGRPVIRGTRIWVSLRDRLILISVSMKNLLAALRVKFGGATVDIVAPSDPEIWDTAWNGSPALRAVRLNEKINPKQITPFSADQIKAIYRATRPSDQ